MANMNTQVNHIFNAELPKHLWDVSPTELKVYAVLCFVCEKNSVVNIATYDLAKRCNLAWKVVEESLGNLCKRGLLSGDLQNNPFLDVEYKICSSEDTSNLNKESRYVPVNGAGNVSDDNVNDNINTSKNDKRLRNDNADTNAVCGQKNQDLPVAAKHLPSSKQELAIYIADKLRDNDNLGLYLSYCRKYPREIILEAFRRACDVPADKIRRSRGAIFTYLVQKMAKEESYAY